MLRLTALATVVLVSACVATDPERGLGAVNGVPSTDPITVFLYQSREVPVAGAVRPGSPPAPSGPAFFSARTPS